LASWTELKHDTIVYTKQPYAMAQAAMAGMSKGGPPPPKPQLVHGYVEPVPEAFGRLANAVENLQQKLTALGYPKDAALEDNLRSYGRLLRRLETIVVALLAPAAFVGSSRLLVSLGMPTPERPWTEPETWVPGVVPPFPWVDCLAYLFGLVAVPLLWECATAPGERGRMGLRAPGGVYPALTLFGVIAGLSAYQRLIYLCLGQRLPSLLAPQNLAYFSGLWAGVALGEEFFFRSVLQRRLTRLWGAVPAILIVAAIFAFPLHYRAPPVENLLVRLPVGLVLGWLFARQESVLSPIVAHFLLNLSAFA